MQQDERRRAIRLAGPKNLHREANRLRVGPIARLWHDEPAALTPDVARPVAIQQAVTALESRYFGLCRTRRRERPGQQCCTNEPVDVAQHVTPRKGHLKHPRTMTGKALAGFLARPSHMRGSEHSRRHQTWVARQFFIHRPLCKC